VNHRTPIKTRQTAEAIDGWKQVSLEHGLLIHKL
jgi:hypothetical protein